MKFPDMSKFTRFRNAVMYVTAVLQLMKYLKHVTVVLKDENGKNNSQYHSHHIMFVVILI